MFGSYININEHSIIPHILWSINSALSFCTIGSTANIHDEGRTENIALLLINLSRFDFPENIWRLF